MDTVRYAIWIHGPLVSARLVPLSSGRQIAFEHVDGHRYQSAVPDVDFEGSAIDVSIATKREHQALSISYEGLERTYFYSFAKPNASPSLDDPSEQSRRHAVH
jgi:hypothetical protein